MTIFTAPAPPPATYQGAMLPISSSLIKVSISASCKRLFTICASRGEEEYTSMSPSSFRSLVMVGFVLSRDLRYCDFVSVANNIEAAAWSNFAKQPQCLLFKYRLRHPEYLKTQTPQSPKALRGMLIWLYWAILSCW